MNPDTDGAGQDPIATDAPEMGTDTSGREPDPQALDAGDAAPQVSDKALKDARSEAAKYRTQLRKLEAANAERETADLSESERITRRNDELEKQLAERDQITRRLALEGAIAVRSNALGIVDAEAAVALLNIGDLDFDDSGRPDPERLDTALRALLKAKPYLRTQPPATSPANPARTEPLGETDDQRRSRLFGSGGGIFDTEVGARLGGGAIDRN